MNILFSILIPAYKAKFLEECIESILVQSYPNFEIIIVDDFSPESIEDVVKKFSDERIHYYRNESNFGAVEVVDNWNKCLAYSSGDYVICMGDDDRLTPRCLDEYINLMRKYPDLGLYHTQAEIIDENSEFKDCLTQRPEYESVWSFMWHRWKGRKQYIGDFCYDARQLKIRGGFYKLPLAWGSDDISAIIASFNTGVANAQKVGFQYRVNSQTISKSGDMQIKLGAILMEQKWYEKILQHVPDNEKDRKYRDSMLLMYPLFFKRKKVYAVVDDIINGWLIGKSVKWFVQGKKYNLHFKEILYATITAIRVEHM